MKTLSAIVITYNEEENIAECLESVKWADEIIVLDSGSIDKTIEISKQYTQNITDTGKISYGQKRNIGIESAKGEWILWLDADERISAELKEEILGAINSDGNESVAFLINRKSFFINRFIRHCGWYPDYTLRLFRKSASIRFNEAKVHEKIVYEGKKSRLISDILHYTDRNFEHYLNKLNNYSGLSAAGLFESGKKASLADIIFRPVFTFFKMYFLQFGILDGYMGLTLCALSGFHVFAKYSKLYFMAQER